MIVFGKNVFKELTDNINKIRKVYLSKTFKDNDIYKIIKDNKISFEVLDNFRMDKLVEGNHQGIIIEINDYDYYELKDLYDMNNIVILDHLEDPHNFGAIIRSCEAAGIKGIIIPKNRGVTVNGTVMKTSSGALEHVKICMVNNLIDAINKLKDKGFFIYGADMEGINYTDIDYPEKVCLIVGNEGNGISKLVKENCDEIVSIPMYGKINSLNASVALSILIFDLINRR